MRERANRPLARELSVCESHRLTAWCEALCIAATRSTASKSAGTLSALTSHFFRLHDQRRDK